VPLNDKQKKAFADWLKGHEVSGVCPACGEQGSWQLHDGILGALDLDLERKKASPSGAGFLALICKRCGNTRFFAAPLIPGMTQK
jgi:hypothetical protein